MTTATPYRDNALALFDAGWIPLPLPYAQKEPPPAGMTGQFNGEPTRELVAEWCANDALDRGAGNVAIRIPDGILAIDVDDYTTEKETKTGAKTMAELTERFGRLPATVRFTSRRDQHSGIYLYRVPSGYECADPGPYVERMNYRHRYVIATGSIHRDTGDVYRLLDEFGDDVGTMPRPEDIVALPERWVAGLATPVVNDGTPKAKPSRAHPIDEWAGNVTRAFGEAVVELRHAGRHPTAVIACNTLLRFADYGDAGAEQALAELRDIFIASIADRANPAQAAEEWDKIESTGRDLIARTVGTRKPDLDRREAGPIAEVVHLDEAIDESSVEREMLAVDWRAAFAHDFGDEAFLVEPVLLARRHHVLYAPKKTGKSLLVLEIVTALATGRPVLLRPASEPVDVLVIDFENDVYDDVIERLEAFGYEAKDLDHLHWYSFPPMGPLDTARGALDLDALLVKHRPVLVVFDSFARVVVGPEDKSDTYRDFYRNAGFVLKRHRVCSIRLDNTGKDESAGARGSSAKGDDVDLIWRMKTREGGLQLVREAQRSNLAPALVNLRRVEFPNLRHEMASDAWPAGTKAAAVTLDRLDVPLTISSREARRLLKGAGESCGNEVLYAAMRFRKQQADSSGAPNGADKVSDEVAL